MRLIVDSHVTVGNNTEIPGPLCPVSRHGNCGTIPHQDTDIGKVKVEKDSIPRDPSCLPVTATPASLPPVSSSTPDSYLPVSLCLILLVQECRVHGITQCVTFRDWPPSLSVNLWSHPGGCFLWLSRFPWCGCITVSPFAPSQASRSFPVWGC